MKKMIQKYFKQSILTILSAAFVLLACQRELSDLEAADYPNTAEIFNDTFVGMGSNFYFPFVSDGAKPDVFSVDKTTGYNSSASIRIDVPNANDPTGSFAGAIFIVDGMARDLSGYNALTFYAKANQNVNIGTMGFGESKYQVLISDVPFTTNWVKYIIPIPDSSKKKKKKGMFLFSAGTQNTNGLGYSFWIDDLKFEKLGTIARKSSAIFNGTDKVTTSFIGVTTTITGLTSTFSLPNGSSQTQNLPSSYFTFTSSNPAVATVDASGNVTTVAAGQAVITASLGGEKSVGSLTINSAGEFVHAPTPTQDPSKVISLFSDTYTNVPVDYYNGYWGGSTTTSSDFQVGNDHVLNYLNLNYVGIQFSSPTIDASSMSHLHFDLYVPNALPAGANLKFEVSDWGADSVYGGGDDKTASVSYTAPKLAGQQWVSFDIPFKTTLAALTNRNHLAQVVLSGTNMNNFYADNIYFYNDGSIIAATPTAAAPAPSHAASGVLSVFSDTYTNVAGTDFNPPWGQTTTVSQVSIAGNSTLKYASLNYQGTQFASALNASSYGFVHLDYYSANSSSLKFYLISGVTPSAVEKSYTLSVPTSTGTNTNGWKSIDIPLSSFSPVVLSNITQLKVDGNGTVFFDNIYFHN